MCLLRFVKPTKQEHLRFKPVNADILCEHFAAVEKLIEDNDVNGDRIWNLDECGITPGKDTADRSQKKRITRRGGGQDVRSMSFAYDNRITIMPVISAAGESGPCLFVLKGKKFPYCSIIQNGKETIDSIADHLPSLSVIGMREEGGGVDSKVFLFWAQHFVKYVSLMTTQGKKVLLIFDGYRSHMSLDVLSLFLQNNVIVYALPAHSSGKLQLLDVVALSVFKRALNGVIHNSMDTVSESGANVFDLFDMIRKAYCDTFTPNVIRTSFARAGIWPLEPKRLMNIPRPLDDSLTDIASVKMIEELISKRRSEYSKEVFGKRVMLMNNKYVDTKKGAVLTCAEAMRLIRETASTVEKAKKVERVEKKQREERTALKLEARRKGLLKIQDATDARRAALSNMDLSQYRCQLSSLRQRRAAARLRTAKKRLHGQI